VLHGIYLKVTVFVCIQSNAKDVYHATGEHSHHSCDCVFMADIQAAQANQTLVAESYRLRRYFSADQCLAIVLWSACDNVAEA